MLVELFRTSSVILINVSSVDAQENVSFFSTTTRTCHEFGPRKKVRIRNRRHVTFLGMHHCQYWIVSARINMARELILTGGGGGNNKGNVRGRLTKLYTRHAKIRKLFTAGGSHNGWPVPCLAIVEEDRLVKYFTPPLETIPLSVLLIHDMDILQCFKIIFLLKDILLFWPKSEMDQLK